LGPLGSVRGAFSNERPYREFTRSAGTGARGRGARDVTGPFRSVHRSGRYLLRELYDGIGDPPPDRCAVGLEFVGPRRAFFKGFLAVALEHQVGGAPDIDLGYHAGKTAGLRSRNVLTPKIALHAILRVRVAVRWHRY